MAPWAEAPATRGERDPSSTREKPAGCWFTRDPEQRTRREHRNCEKQAFRTSAHEGRTADRAGTVCGGTNAQGSVSEAEGAGNGPFLPAPGPASAARLLGS